MRAIILALTLILPIQAHAQSDNPIVARIGALVDAYNAQDLVALGAIYHPEAALFAPGEASILGRDAIVQHYANAIAAGSHDVQFRVFDIRPSETMAVAVGETVVQVGEAGFVTRFMHVWEVVGDELLLTRDMYHLVARQ